VSEPSIDVHAHHVPASVLARIREAGVRKTFPHCIVEDVPGGGVRFKIGDEPWTRPLAPGLTNIDARTERLSRSAIVAQLNGGWLDIFGYSLPSEEGAAWSAFLNETLRDSLASASTTDVMYLPLATVPLQDGPLAAAELERAAKLGHAGAMIGTWIPGKDGGRELDDAGLEIFWGTAEALGLPVFVHPGFAGADARFHDLGLANAVARPNETALAMSRLLYSGVLERYPALKIVVAHGGGALPAILGRLARNFEILQKTGEKVADPVAGFSKLYFDSIVFSPHALRALVEVAHPGRVMLGSDDPFPIGDPHPRAVVETTLSEEQRRLVLHENACETFAGLRARC
jgi:aminocarboxymuconate-semialdehyde decarboxylase